MSPESNHELEEERSSRSKLVSSIKLVASAALLVSSVMTYQSSVVSRQDPATANDVNFRRRLASLTGIPSYMEELTKDLAERKKLFDDTPPEEVKYWFEYTGPLQVSRLT